MRQSSAGRPHTQRTRPVVQVACAVLAVQCAVQGMVAHSVASELWWRTELARALVRVKHPTAALAQPLPQPDWRGWVPSAGTAVLVTVALVLLAALVVRAGRGWWLLLVAALPLVPAQLAPGVWAPPMLNQVANALVWPAGATAPSTDWAWIEAAITAVLVVIPAATLGAIGGLRRPRTSGRQVLARLLPAGVAVGLVLGWEAAAGWTADPWTAGWRALFAVVGAMVATGTLRTRAVLLPVAVLPALAAGALRWTTGPGGSVTLALAPAAVLMSVAAVTGGLVAMVQPVIGRWLRIGWDAWWQMLAADLAAKNAVRDARVAARAADRAREATRAAVRAGGGAGAAWDAGDAGDADADRLVGVSPRPSHAAPARAGGRHRA